MSNTFSSNTPVDIRLRRENKAITVSFPTDEQWKQRSRKVRTIIRQLGPGTSETDIDGGDAADLELLHKIALTPTDKPGSVASTLIQDFDEAEAAILIERLTRAEVTDAPARDGDALIVSLTVLGGVVTKHKMRQPSTKEIRQHRKAAFSFRNLRHGQQQLISNLEEFGRFYDSLLVDREGYDSEVPLVHKVSVIAEVLQVVEALDAEEDPADFFQR